MKPTYLAAAVAAVLAGCGIGALTSGAMPAFTDTPARAFQALGAVSVISETRPPGASWSELHAPKLTAEARARYGREVDAIMRMRHADLPSGAGAVSSAIAIAYE